MTTGIIISEGLKTDLKNYLPENVNLLISDGNPYLRYYANENGIKLKELTPDYGKHGRFAELIRDLYIKKYADKTYIFLDGNKRNHAYYASVINFSLKKTVTFRLSSDCDEFIFDM